MQLHLTESRLWELHLEGCTRVLRARVLGFGSHLNDFFSFSQSLSTLALIEEFLGKRDVPCLPGAVGQGTEKWVRNVSYFREYTAALFLESYQDLFKGFLFLSFFLLSNSILFQVYRNM